VEKISWVFELFDKMSAPLRHIDESLEHLNKQLKASAVGLNASMEIFERFSSLTERVFQAGELALQATEFKEHTLIAFEAIGKTREQADAIYKQSADFAFQTGNNLEQMVDFARGLAVAGRSAGDIRLLQQAVSDIGVLRGADKMPALQDALLKLANSSKFTTRNLMALKEAGIDQDKIYQALGKTYGMTAAAAEKLMQKGGFAGAAGLQAVLNVVAGMEVGGLGAASKADAQTSDKLLKSTKTGISLLFDSLDTGPLDNALGKLKAIVDPKTTSGQALKGDINALFRFIGDRATGAIDYFQNTSWYQMVLDAMMAPFVAVPKMLLTLLQPVGENLYNWAKGTWYDLVGAWNDFENKIVKVWMPLGSQMVDALTLGLSVGIDALESKVKELGSTAVAALKDVLGIHSPSKVFEEMGRMSAEGFAQGLASRQGSYRMATPGFGQQLGGGGRGGGNAFHFTINASGSSASEARAIGDRARDLVLSGLSAAFEEVALETGVS
jgi:hypothetical protein